MNSEFESMKSVDLISDKNFELEGCERGPCLKSVKKPNLSVIYKKIMELKGRFGKSAVTATFYGESKILPADSCTNIYYQSNIEINGFYWIKNECSKDPFKVYCD